MADYVTGKYVSGIRTSAGDLQIDYTKLANLPDIYEKKDILSSTTRTSFGIDSSATPDDAFQVIKDELDSKAGIDVISELVSDVVYSKDDVLTSTSKEKYGLDSDALPNDVFEQLSVLNRHWWEKKSTDVQVQYMIGEARSIVSVYLQKNKDYNEYGPYFKYSDSVEVDEYGNLKLVNPTTTRVKPSSHSVPDLANKYFCFIDSDVVYHINSTGAIINVSSEDTTCVKVNAYLVFVKHIYKDDTVLVDSTKRDAYPDNGESGSYHYNYLGLPLDNVISSLRCATGFYIGTGASGISDKNSLTFEFTPKFLLVVKASTMLLHINYAAMVYIGQPGNFAVNDKTIEWWGSSANEQMNVNEVTYFYFALG